MSAVNVRYGLYPGDRLMVTAGKKKKRATVVKEYPFHILMDWGKYKSSVNKIDVYTGDVKLASGKFLCLCMAVVVAAESVSPVRRIGTDIFFEIVSKWFYVRWCIW